MPVNLSRLYDLFVGAMRERRIQDRAFVWATGPSHGVESDEETFEKYGHGTFAHLLADGEDAEDTYTFALEDVMLAGSSYWSPPMQFRVSHDFGEPQILFRYVPESGGELSIE